MYFRTFTERLHLGLNWKPNVHKYTYFEEQMFSMFILFAYILKSITENIPLDLELAAPGRNRDV